jgi:hypothetical protein
MMLGTTSLRAILLQLLFVSLLPCGRPLARGKLIGSRPNRLMVPSQHASTIRLASIPPAFLRLRGGGEGGCGACPSGGGCGKKACGSTAFDDDVEAGQALMDASSSEDDGKAAAAALAKQQQLAKTQASTLIAMQRDEEVRMCLADRVRCDSWVQC